MYVVYIIRSDCGHYYIGVTEDVAVVSAA